MRETVILKDNHQGRHAGQADRQDKGQKRDRDSTVMKRKDRQERERGIKVTGRKVGHWTGRAVGQL
jgi:hypothetical protein